MSDPQIEAKDLLAQLAANLATHLDILGPRGLDKEIYKYSLIPAGKLFRPSLCALAYMEETKNYELKKQLSERKDIALFASFLEMHHVYTLIHDDLPAMDNDDYRRGRESSHKKFNEWKALLTGDGLNILSFHLLSHMNSPIALKLLKIATRCTGSNGLIYGQYLDLSSMMNDSFKNVRQTHLLKTARLIQLALVGGQALAKNTIDGTTKEYWKFGESIGLVFQFLDDLDDLREENSHEQEINPWKKYKDQCHVELFKHLNRCQSFLDTRPVIKQYIERYLNKNIDVLKENQDFYLKNGFQEQELLKIFASFNLTSHH
jgi:geranylgeranyl pyrophosphate synthase